MFSKLQGYFKKNQDKFDYQEKQTVPHWDWKPHPEYAVLLFFLHSGQDVIHADTKLGHLYINYE